MGSGFQLVLGGVAWVFGENWKFWVMDSSTQIITQL